MRGVVFECASRTTCSLTTDEVGRDNSSAPLSVSSVDRLQMARDMFHVPVLEGEVVSYLSASAGGVVIDATLGGGGHAAALLRGVPDVRLLGIDRDPEAREASRRRLASFGSRVRVVDAAFADLREVREREADFIGGARVLGILMDLGVSSHQLDDARRGFSLRVDAPLDMRMDPSSGLDAASVIAHIDEEQLRVLLARHGEARFARAIAASIVANRPRTTFELVAAVERAVPPAHRRRGHVATRTFQALRVLVNDEEFQLREGLAAALDVLDLDGVLVVIAYHSGEDRVVKDVLAEAASGGCRCPIELGCVCGAIHRVSVVKASAMMATAHEVARNPRARSARLRVARKIVP